MNDIQRISDSHVAFAQELMYDTSGKYRHVRCSGTILAFDVVTSDDDGYLNNISAVLHKKALERGVLLRPLGNTVYVMPPYCITDEELDKVYDCIRKII